MKKCIFLCTWASLSFANSPEANIQEASHTLLQQNEVAFSNDLVFPSPVYQATDEDLRRDSVLTAKLINQAIDYNQEQLLPALLSLYQQSPTPDPILMQYTQAIILHHQGKLSEALALLTLLSEQYPHFQPLRFRLAQIQFDYWQNRAATKNFAQLKETAPPAILVAIEQYQSAIKQRQQWDIKLGVSYLRENNVNNASSQPYIDIGGRRFEKQKGALPQKANGIKYVLALSKAINVVNNHYFYTENHLSGRFFWDNHSFNDLTNRLYLGYQYQNHRSRLAFLPFYEQRWYANARYHNNIGGRLELSYRFDSTWQVSLATEGGHLHYRFPNQSDNGNQWLYSATLIYPFSPLHYVYVGGDYINENSGNKQHASKRKIMRVGWRKEWWGGFSSLVQVSLSQRVFAQPSPVFNLVRKDIERNITLSIWNKNWHIESVIPKLTFYHSRLKSNLAQLYSATRNQIYLNFDWEF